MGILKVHCPELSGFNLIPAIWLYNVSQFRNVKFIITPYKSLIKYKYPGEDWQEIDADDYTLERREIGEEISFPRKFIKFKATVKGRFPSNTSQPLKFADGQTVNCRTINSLSNIDFDSIFVNSESNVYRINAKYLVSFFRPRPNRFENTNCYYLEQPLNAIVDEPQHNQAIKTQGLSDNFTIAGTNLRNFSLVEDTSVQPTICRRLTQECDFKVYKCENLVHEETREVCPEVEKINCFLDYDNQTVIEKLLSNTELN